MIGRLAPLSGGLLAFCVTAESVQQLSFKHAADASGDDDGNLLDAVRHPLVWLGAGLWLVEAVVWIVVLERAPLSVAYPIMSLTYATVPVLGAGLLRERLARRQVVGIALIAIGALAIGLSG